MPRNNKTVLGWGSLESASPRASLSHPPFSQTELLPEILPLPPPRTIHPRRKRQRSEPPSEARPPEARPLEPRPPGAAFRPPMYRASPRMTPWLQAEALPTLVDLDGALRPVDEPARTGAGWEVAATVQDRALIDDYDDAGVGSPYAALLQPRYINLLGAILLMAAGLLAYDDPELSTIAAVAVWSAAIVMVMCVVCIFQRARE